MKYGVKSIALTILTTKKKHYDGKCTRNFHYIEVPHKENTEYIHLAIVLILCIK